MNYVKGLFDTDGCYSKYKVKNKWWVESISIFQDNKELMESIKLTILNKLKLKCYGIYKCKNYNGWSLDITRSKKGVFNFLHYPYNYQSKQYCAGVIDGDGYFLYAKRNNAKTHQIGFGLRAVKKRKEGLAFYNVKAYIKTNLGINLKYKYTESDNHFRFYTTKQIEAIKIAHHFKDVCVIKKDKIDVILSNINRFIKMCRGCGYLFEGNGQANFCAKPCKQRYFTKKFQYLNTLCHNKKRKNNPEKYREINRRARLRKKGVDVPYNIEYMIRK